MIKNNVYNSCIIDFITPVLFAISCDKVFFFYGMMLYLPVTVIKWGLGFSGDITVVPVCSSCDLSVLETVLSLLLSPVSSKRPLTCIGTPTPLTTVLPLAVYSILTHKGYNHTNAKFKNHLSRIWNIFLFDEIFLPHLVWRWHGCLWAWALA